MLKYVYTFWHLRCIHVFSNSVPISVIKASHNSYVSSILVSLKIKSEPNRQISCHLYITGNSALTLHSIAGKFRGLQGFLNLENFILEIFSKVKN